MADNPKKKIYCAIYTRKSTSEGLDQDFTSLDNQRESAESYIASQKSEGWITIPDHYDDGGFTGANTERPALKRLIADIKDDKIDCVIVYKVDRLSRSLLDFVQLLELFEKNKVAFVSVTQHFNTNTSMGRLTLNILLSFAQFEREIISERVKDKMGAARKRGKYLGGVPILGYDLDKLNHKLVINKKEAALVHEIFDIYIKEESLLSTAIILNEKGYRTKQHTIKNNRTFGGNKFKKTDVQLLLRNVLYVGRVKYAGELYPGEQAPIISNEVFDKAQDVLTNNRRERYNPKGTNCTGLLNHILRCRACNSIMFHTYARKGEHKYRYYVCMNAQKRGYKLCPTRSVNAQAMEEAVIEQLKNMANDDKELTRIMELVNSDPKKPPISKEGIKDALLVTSPIWDALLFAQKHRVLRLLLKEASYDARDDKLILTLNENGIRFLHLLGEPVKCNSNPKSI